MTNNDRAYAVYCLDTGKYFTESVAQQYHMSIEELETELAIFRCSPLYVQKYANFVEQQKKQSLKDCAFTPWRDNFTMRQLPNRRIECIVRDENTKLPFLYHAYLPGKDYLDHINDRTAWVGNDAFQYVIEYEQIGIWQNRPADTQLRFLVMRFDAATFLPFRRTINYLEYERITGTPFPEDPDAKVSKYKTPVFKTPAFINNKMVEANESAAKSQLGELLARRDIQFQKGDDWVDYHVSDKELEVAGELVSMTDLDRLRVLSEEGPRTEEWNLLRYVDGFYKKWQLLEPMLAAEKVGNITVFKEQVRNIYDRAVEVAAGPKPKAEPQSTRKPDNFNRMRPSWAVEHVQAIQSRSGKPASDGLTMKDTAEDEDLAEIKQEFRNLLKAPHKSVCMRTLNILGNLLGHLSETEREQLEDYYRREVLPDIRPEFLGVIETSLNRYWVKDQSSSSPKFNSVSGEQKEPMQEKSQTTPAIATTQTKSDQQLAPEKLEPKPEPKPEPAPELSLQELMKRRRSILSQLRSGLDPALLEELQVSESRLLALDRKDQPAGFPEGNVLLLYLYSVAKIKTGSGMTQRVMVQLSNDEVNEFLGLVTKGFK